MLKLRELLDVSVGYLLGVGLAMVDDVERAIVNSKLPPDTQDVVLTVYGHLSGQDSLRHAAVLRTEIPQARDDIGNAGPGGPARPA
ncbi:hypothetical protein [Nonomuraea turcica]|uniref:hypothetical protein n=1 Tax=Nonomuraea sp. G32 TaxID=3067274 RepID=UPI00273B39F4|nr:hypothetical protein [Nonomuraea sp. G32]MDP4510933.1 hypothetical protein [Nonomuraea sp. G32]